MCGRFASHRPADEIRAMFGTTNPVPNVPPRFNVALRPLHERMPVVLEAADWPVWLGEAEGEPGTLLRPSAALFRVWEVSTRVNNVRNDDPALLTPAAWREPTRTAMPDVPAAPAQRFTAGDAGLVLLGFASGSADVFGFLMLGAVLPSAMTGNTALLGLAIGQGRWLDATRPLAALASFLLGAALASAPLLVWPETVAKPRRIVRLLAAETCLLGAFACAWPWFGASSAAGAPYALILLVASAMGVQSIAARVAGRPGLVTVVFTSTLSAIGSELTATLLRRPHRLPLDAWRQIAAFAGYALGAMAAAGMAETLPAFAALPALAAIGATLLFARDAA